MNIDKLTSMAITRCLSPKKLNTPYGTKVVPCGKCRYCKHSSRYRFKTLLQNELAFSPAIYFTLTYAPDFLPLVPLYDIKYKDSAIIARGSHYVLRSNEIISTITNSLDNLNYNEYKEYEKYNSSDIPKDHFAVLETKDIQLFIKNLRTDILKEFHENFRFYCLAEYGGKSFRPHYHFIIFGKNAHQYIKFARERWTYGFLYNSGTVNASNFSLSSYLSQYLSSSTSIPSFLTSSRPQKIYHSKNFGYYYLLPFIKDFYQNPNLLLAQEFTIFSLTRTDYYSNGKTSIFTEQSFNLEDLTSNLCSYTLQSDTEFPLAYTLQSTNKKTTYFIDKHTYKIKVPFDFFNYLFPNIWGRPRNLSYLDSLLLNSFDNLHKPDSLDLYIKIFLSEPNLADSIGLLLPDLTNMDSIKDTPLSLQLNLSKDSLNFLIGTQTPLNVYQESYFVLKEEYKNFTSLKYDSKEYNAQCHIMSHLLNRVMSIYYRSKHYCINIKHHFQSFKKYYDTYLIFSNLLEKSKLKDYYALLEYNNTYPYEYFLLDFPLAQKSQIEHTLLPIQTEFLRDLVKHKEINNRNENLFKDFNPFDELPF